MKDKRKAQNKGNRPSILFPEAEEAGFEIPMAVGFRQLQKKGGATKGSPFHLILMAKHSESRDTEFKGG